MIARAALVALLCATASVNGWAGSFAQRFCDTAPKLDAAQTDRLLRFADAVKRELEASGARAALVSRSGLNLDRFGIRYSHAGISLKASDNGAWSVRQLYYACEEKAPRLFDQGMAGFVAGTDDPTLGYVSIVLLPDEAARPIEQAALNRTLALQLVGATYSANAYPFSVRYQNCNQWLIELLAAAWGGLADGADLRERAQRWLADARYAPGEVDARKPWWWLAAAFVPWLHFDDRPAQQRTTSLVKLSLPSSIEVFARQRESGARRIELCHEGNRIVVHEGWTPMAAGCAASAGDRVIALD